MLTGIVTEDISYLCYLILKGGCYFGNEEEEEVSAATDQVSSFDEWFGSLQ